MSVSTTNYNFVATFTMKHNCIKIISLCLVLLTLKNIGYGQTDQHQLRFGVIPVSSYDADLGLKYGAVVNLFDFTPKADDYSQYLLVRLTHTTRNTLNFQSVLESERIFPNTITLLEGGYTNDQRLDFFGFNGIESIYNSNYIDSDSPDFIDRNFYSLNRKLIRTRCDVQKKTGTKFRILLGATFSKFILKSNKTVVNTLYDNYNKWGIISDNELNGGGIFNTKFGAIFDNRNNKSNPKSGQWAEAFVVYAPKIFKQPHFSKLVLTYRYYKSIRKDKATLALRLSHQSRLSGKIPHYMLPIYFDSQLNEDGLGGAYTMRGIARNRLISDGFTLANIESRFDLTHFNLAQLRFMIRGSLFCDLAYLHQPYNFNTSNIPENEKIAFFNTTKQPLNAGFGPGINIIYNENNVITINYGLNTNKQYGEGGFYVGSKFLF